MGAAVLGEATLEYADHEAEDGLEGAPGGVAAAGDVGGHKATMGQESSTFSKCWRER